MNNLFSGIVKCGYCGLAKEVLGKIGFLGGILGGLGLAKEVLGKLGLELTATGLLFPLELG